MTDSDLIKQIKLLKQIKPRHDWALLTKKAIFEDKEDKILLPQSKTWVFWNVFPRISFNYRFVLASFIFLGILGLATVNLAQNSLPGDFLYSVKRISEKSRAVFVSEKERPKAQLELANKRLDELTIIAEENNVQKFAPAITELPSWD